MLITSTLIKTPEKAFIWIAALAGVVFLIVTPPFQVPDEFEHFYRAYQISDFHFISEMQEDIAGGFLPSSLSQTGAIWSHIPFHPDKKATPKHFADSFKIPLNPAEKIFTPFVNVARHHPVRYLLPAIGISIGKLLGLSPIFLIYLGRFSSLVISIVMTAIAIKITPAFKWVFLLLALTPTAVFQRSSLSGDDLTTALSYIVIAIVLRFLLVPDSDSELTETTVEHRQISDRSILLLGFLSILLGLCKIAYFMIPSLVFLIPIRKFGSLKRYLLSCSLIMASGIVALLIWSQVNHEVMSSAGGYRLPDIDPSAQLRFTLAHPLHFLAAVWRDVANHLLIYLDHFIGVLGWLDTTIPDIVPLFYCIVFTTVALFDSEHRLYLPLKHKSLFQFIVAFTILLIYFLHYLIWNPVGATVVEGMQGRYLAPIAPLALLLLYTHKTAAILRPGQLGWLSVSYTAFALTLSLASLWARYYR